MSQFISLSVAGIASYGCVYALIAMGLVVTYKTSGIFNFAQGAVGMIAAYLYYQLSQVWLVPALPALLVTVLLFAPLIGAVLERVVVRRLEHAGLEAQLTVTIALLLLGVAVATAIWDPQEVRVIPKFFNGQQVSIGGVNLTYQQLIIMGAAALSAVGLRLFFVRTRAGIATRAVVDDRDLAALTGAAPARYAQLGWALGCSLAALAGVLIAPQLGALSVTTLTLLVVTGCSAAMVGRLGSLPMTFAGAIVLGLLYSYGVGYLPITPGWGAFRNAIPMVFLLLVILVLPQPRASLKRRTKVRAPRIVRPRESFLAGSVLVIAAIVLSRVLGGTYLDMANRGVAVGIIMLSIVLLTGYGGQVSLCQLSFAGLGAYGMSKVGGAHGSLLGIVAAMALAATVGAVVALPSLRLRGLYLALATMAFANAMDIAFFGQVRFFGVVSNIEVARPDVFGFQLSSSRTLLIALSVVFAIVAIGLLAFRRSRFGRRLAAINDSPGACLTLGIDTTRSKLAVFTISAAIAGLGGALYGAVQTQVGPNDFAFLLSLTLLLTAVVWGIRSTAGVLVGGLVFAFGPLLQQHLTEPRAAFELLVGLAAIGIAHNPEGVIGGNTPLRRWRDRRASSETVVADCQLVAESRSGRLTHVAG